MASYHRPECLTQRDAEVHVALRVDDGDGRYIIYGRIGGWVDGWMGWWDV
jgi:hypothetical protein